MILLKAAFPFKGLGRSALVTMLVLCAAMMTMKPAHATITGSCFGHFGSIEQIGDVTADGQIERPDPVLVIVNTLDARTEPMGRGSVSGTLAFGDRVYLEAIQGDYLLVNTESNQRVSPENRVPPIGWVDADGLLCRTTPLETAEDISQKFYVRTAANFADEDENIIQPTAGPRTEACALLNNTCQRLSRFSLFFIFAEDTETGRLLLMGEQLSQPTSVPIGWVDEEDGFRWNTRFGLRPNDNLVYSEETGQLDAAEEEVVCLYETLDQAASAARDDVCLYPILGGPRWFESTIRIPILERVTHLGEWYYRVAMPIAGVGEDSSGAILDRLAGLDEAIGALQGLRNLDVFFLIDGTQSMDVHIDALVGRGASVGVIPAIQQAFATDPRFANVSVRYGFRVYRDVYTGERFGIGEGMPLGNSCNPTEAELARNRRDVQAGIAAIDVFEGDDSGIRDTDHEENLALGLTIALGDMSTCPGNVRLLFVIGDTGFDGERLQADNVPVFSEERIVQEFARTMASGSPVIPFFIQVPRAPGNIGSDNYNSAYDLFARQARFMIRGIQDRYIEGITDQARDRIQEKMRIEENFYSLEGQSISAAQADLVAYVLDRVETYGDQRPVNEIIAELRTGESLVQIIEALSSDAGGVPALRLTQIERVVCDTLGDGCTERIVSDVAEGYISEDAALAIDLLMSAEELDGWQQRLDGFRDLTIFDEEDLSWAIINMLELGTRIATGSLTPSELDMSLGEYLSRRLGLPVAEGTPLLGYSLRDFVAKIEEAESGEENGGLIFRGDEVSTCELLAVGEWLNSHIRILNAIDRGFFPVVRPQDSNCAEMRGEIGARNLLAEARFPDMERMSFNFVRLSDVVEYWVPQEFLP